MQRRTLAEVLVLVTGTFACRPACHAQSALPAKGDTATLGVAQTAPAADVAPPVAAPPQGQPEASQLRIVRLSQVHGSVQMDRNTGRGFEVAFANIPVVAGARLRSTHGVAEVEFEDNSSLRLAPDTEVLFTRLGRSATGTTETTIEVTRGLVYVGLAKTKGNQFALTEGSARLELTPGTHLRLDANPSQSELAVFDGGAAVALGSSNTLVGKKQTLTLTPGTQTVSSVAKGTEETEWDAWDKQQNDYHRQSASLAGTGGFGLYGANDLNYYGSFVDMPGCGSMWRPYFASAAWDPFASGTWTWYPSAGYSWVSPYPWGWLPFHSGSWASCGAAGWGWRPGGTWYGLGNTPAMRIGHHPLPHPVPPAPVRGTGTLVPVNMKQLQMSGPNDNQKFTFRRDSAGFGVPRTAFGNLRGVASHVEQTGAVTRGMPAGTVSLASSAYSSPRGTAAGSFGGSPSFGAHAANAGRGASTAASSPTRSAGAQGVGGGMAGPSAGGMSSAGHSSAPSGASGGGSHR